MSRIAFDNSYARLPPRFFAQVEPTAVSAPRLIKLNEALATELGLDPAWLSSPQGVATLAGNSLVEGATPIATAYAGHQFGGFNPQLGDGRAILLGEVIDRAGRRRDIQLKGAGPTPFSRRGDGRAALGPVLREYIVGEAMAALGIPTTRALAAVRTGDWVRREQMLPGAILTRVAASHIRIGTFQFFATRSDTEGLRVLADHAIARHYPDCAGSNAPYLCLLEAVIAAQAALVGQWLLIGFIHGVMNTDNMSIAGETIDYGPCAFMDSYDAGTVFSSIDEHGRYAYGNQPAIARWNLTRLAEALLPLLAEDVDQAIPIAQAALDRFEPLFQSGLVAGFRRKLGLTTEELEDIELIRTLLETMQRGKADFTLTFRRLGQDATSLAHG
ncbi:protein adenylyltransferase SelO, partial [Bosea sp. (in: a-proteobacteria)]|uniref:protein adenylyltransferase SelO n=1 Tax=Bosea sp. (in: a-proteobacteria) TaxID=1871050 RepID=UPI002FCA0DB1